MSDTKIFISHSSKNKPVAQIIVNLLERLAISEENIFCSSVPGTDVKETIPDTVFKKIKQSNIDIIILSEEYYHSAYCLNEAGIIWFKKSTSENAHAIVIALPEIKLDDMKGFINSDYIQYDFSNEDDIAKFLDFASALSAKPVSHSSVRETIKESKEKYDQYILERSFNARAKNEYIKKITTDDEKILLYFFIINETLFSTIKELKAWVIEKEIEFFNLENTLALLETKNILSVQDESIALNAEFVAHFNANRFINLLNYRRSFEYRRCVSSILFEKFLCENKISGDEMLLFAFLTEENISEFTYPFDNKFSEKLKNWEKYNNISTEIDKKSVFYIKEHVENEFFHYVRDSGKHKIYRVSSMLLGNIRKNHSDLIKAAKKAYDINEKVKEFHTTY